MQLTSGVVGLLTVSGNEFKFPLWFPWPVLRPLVRVDIFLREKDFEGRPVKNRGNLEKIPLFDSWALKYPSRTG
jgi:hypothetical protein